MSARLPGPTLNPWLSLLTSIGMIAGPAAEAQSLVWELPSPPPPVVLVPRQPPPPVPTLRAKAAEPAPAQQARSLTWEAIPPNPPPIQPPQSLPISPETAIAARPESSLAWELVPYDDGSLAFTPTTAQAIPEAGVFGQLLARETTLRWYLVPEDQILTPSVALANGTIRPEPPYLPEPPPPIWPKVRGLARGITVNGDPYPDTGLNVPNGFAQDREFTVSTTLTGTSRTRSCRVAPGGNWVDCADSEAYLDITPFKGEYASLGFQYTIQSLTSRNRGTGQFAGQSLGFRTAINLTPTTGLAFGGEHIIQLDNTTDLGRNFYLVMSQAIPLSRGQNPILFVATAGVGSDFYGYAGNGTLGSTNCLSGNNISSLNYPQGTDCFWGPIGALTLHLGSQVSLGYEWFGYGIGAGLSVRPIKTIPLTFSLYATDFLGNTPSYLDGLCTTNPCEPRYYGRLTMSF
ncbi:hypothetical protein [Synechococcus sp. RedBA-s]|uniref:hypothetical protein n=1 Tax=Synechococcus sp. RedBA-s TaxID=2823741 RepID=UPI0020CEF878|nr:hypothetical protein [Synechococcus sp. RedBA-s]MCP9801405.1 hypothetical protein [Synechococcus sp. RedBA-s]